ncbi:MAG TPA: metalloregulator ArsR/SmtB family transcription factor [Burkholderiales bacterium]|nr:metalloregulator ArsR/SmtB family transcription factor [Burkholderiales bacterium]
MRVKTLNPSAMHRAADSACGLMKTLAHPDRLMLLCQLAHTGEMTVGELEERLDIHQPTLSQQLTVLRDEKLVDTRREGKYIYYRVRPGAALALLEAVYREFCGPGKNR